MARHGRCRVPQAFWRAAERAGLSRSALLRQARLPATLSTSGDFWLTTAQYFALWRAVECLSGNPAIGLAMTLDTETSAHPPATLSAFFARDFRDGLVRLARFKRLCTPEQLKVVEAAHECTVMVDWPSGTGAEPDPSVDVTFAVIVELGRRGTGQHINPVRLELMRSGPAVADHHNYFGAPILCGRNRNALVLDTADLDRPFIGHNPELLDILTPALTASLREFEAEDTVLDVVRRVLVRRLASGRPDLQDIARELGTSDRTLQRRITEAGSTFRKLLEDSRQELARQMLMDERNGVDEVAFMLGYQDSSSFYRAFRAREGVTPSQWRSLN